MALRKDETQNQLQSPDAKLREHPLFNGSQSVGMISGENPRFPAQAAGHQALGEHLKQIGLKHEERDGRYGSPEKSYMVYGPTREQMYQLGQSFGQESVVYSQGGKHELLYTNGPQAGRFHPGIDHEFFQQEPEDYYTNMPELGGYMRLNFDFDTLHPTNLNQDGAVAALQTRAAHGQPPQAAPAEQPVTKAEIKAALVSSLKKALGASLRPAAPAPHPHAYPWHAEHTDHHLHVASPGVVLRSSRTQLQKAQQPHPHMDGSKPPAPGVDHLQSPHPTNDQAAPVGVSTYGKFALPYGHVDKSNPTDLFHYPYHGKNQDIDRLVKDHGYTTYYAGGKYGRPDLANRNYNTKHLMVYDPSPESGASFGTEAYTDGWRKIHELAHALTYPELNQTYGEGRRIGKLGQHRTLREGLRAVHWEWLAAHKQRELSQQIGVHVPDHVFHKELNTVMHDAIHRAVTGKFTEPSGEGFRPHEHKLPLETALGMVRESAHNLGITGMHDLIKKTEGTTMADDKMHEPKEWREALAKAVKDRVDAYSKELLELRQRELKKNLDPALAGPAPEMKPVDPCPLCGMEDLPGKCKCLQGPAAGAPPPAAPLALNEDNVVKPPDPALKNEDCGPMVKSDSPDHYNYYLVHKETGKIHGGNEFKEDAHDAAKDHPEAGSLKVSHRTKVSPEAKAAFHGDNKIKSKLHKDELEKGDKTHVCKAALCTKGIKGDAEYCKGHKDLEWNDANAKATAAGKKGVPVKDGDGVAKAELKTKPKEPVKAASGNGIKIKPLKKVGLPAGAKGLKTALMHDKSAGAAPAGAPAGAGPKMPTMAQHADRASMFAAHTPPAKPAAGAAPAAAPKGLDKIKAAGAQPIAPMGGGPKLPGAAPAGPPKLPGAAAAGPKLPGAGAPPAMPKPAPAPGVGGLKTPPLAAAGGAPKPAGPPALPKPAAPAAPKAAAPAAPKPALGKSESSIADLKKALGSCALCNKDEHLGQCS